MYLLHLLTLLWALVGLIGRVHCKCSLTPIANDERTIAYVCTYGDLTDLDEISSEAEWIEFTVSRFHHIPDNAFWRFSKLRQLSFYNCHVKSIGLDAFAGLNQLEWLIFHGTRIHVVRNTWFQHLFNLRKLVLDRCDLVHIETDAFRALLKLETLSLRDNDLDCLPIEELSGLRALRTVRLDGNPWLCECRKRLERYFHERSIVQETDHCLSKALLCRTYQCMTYIGFPLLSSTLNSSETGRSTIHGNEFQTNVFTSLDRLPDKTTWITISGLKIETLPKYGFFRFGNSLRTLAFVDCGISKIESGAFAGLHRLERLTLVGNKFQTVGAGWFRDLLGLRQLILQGNSIERIDRTALWHVGETLQHLDVRNNRLRCLPIEELAVLKKLERLDVIDNPWICSCRKNLQNFLTDKNIGFEINSGRCYEHENEIRPVDDGGRHQQASLNTSTVALGKVTWSSFEETVQQSNISIVRPFPAPAATIEIRPATHQPPVDTGTCYPENTNGEQTSVYTCRGITSVEDLNVIPSKVHTIRVILSDIKNIPHDSFARFNGYLSRVELRDCAIESIESGAFSNLQNLKYLSLRNNQLEFIEADTFRGLFNLRYLDLSHNRIQRISNDVFDELPYLVNLDISQNSMNCIGVEYMANRLHYLSMLHVSDNPWSCLCVVKLAEFLQKRGIHYDKHSLPLQEDCYVPELPETTSVVSVTTTSAPVWNETVEGSCTAYEDATGSRYICTGGNLPLLLQTVPSGVSAIEFHDGHLPRLPPGSLTRFVNLRELVIRNCGLVTVEPGAFDGLNKLENLTIRDNPLEMIGSNWLNLNNLDRLDLRGNSIRYIAPGAFQHLGRLSYLNVEGNELKCIFTSDLNDMPNVYIIEFSGNPLKWRCRVELEQFLEARKIKFVRVENSCEGKKLVRNLLWQNRTAGSFDCPSECSAAANIDHFFVLLVLPILITWVY